MHKLESLDPPLFPKLGWASTGEYEGYYNKGTFLDFPVPKTYGVAHHQTGLGVYVSTDGNGVDNNSVVIKKLNHNANERDRRKKMNFLFSSLRSCLPASYQHKKLSIPRTVLQSLKYIPELQEQVKNLIQKKEDLLRRISDQRDNGRCVKPQSKAVASYVSTVFATKHGDNEVMAQILSSKIHKFSIYNVLSGLEEDGFVVVDVKSSSSRGERILYTLHLQLDKTDHYKLICQELSQRMLYLYEERGNSFR
ncbi:unnamed protein product [Eruca vesicaria subsp. sativa]|uniref:BHLH domain-containing protein n=1 Tax=Eruca vesicaria subsp. sativa TaxID=29727 RepID=A0ABC8MAC6_ERUVS|nr:unnamed protein product [Eruca vesicaria subsp. sativa]